jgi:RNA polymerase sigma-70 factor (ECF subfamily)
LELTQRTFVAAIEQRWRFDGRSDITTWLCGIARHKLADHYRRAEREQRRQIKLEVREIDRIGEDSGTGADDRELIAAAFRALPPAQRAVLVFVDLDGLSVPEAARLMGKNRLATQSLLHRARDRFRRAFRGEAEQ